MKFTMFITATIPATVAGGRSPSSTRPAKGSVKSSTYTPEATGIAAARI